MSSCWGAEPSGFLVGERCRPHLQRGWGSREDEHICQRFRPGDGRRFGGQFGNRHHLGDGRPRRGAAEMDGVALLAARAKERRPEFVGVQARARLVVLAVEDEWVLDRFGQGLSTERTPTHAEAC